LTAKTLKEVGWRIVLPEIRKIVREELDTTNKRIEDLRSLTNERFNAVEDRFKALNERLDAVNAKVDGLEKRLDVTQRIAVLEAEVRELRSKLG